ncbi:DegT/DnrJ/EryC1/StrS family aminotransferase [Microcoleus sp. FACHB-672]|uniref:DegT/DnrJ/EryC1/StrS family aminotransferase n=1 Tax=Microcoleus sp. FACHB-672 TaxID=2692825 RepID=UPI0016898A8F|nr:DegT/DnrJ/EryC1/StrS aminotransferase family protein [Microcoleus sp. FACHB-672]MBD2043059.1 DegT/DnrJ/EryC1/StrS aminotransferase family protein [Microcoleus sp. FACHB-672]
MTSASVKVPFVDLTLQHQPIQAEIEQAIQTVLRRGDFVLGETLAEFESAFAAACGVPYGIGVACGTDATALGLQACGIDTGDEVILPANTFIATLIGVLRAGATPILVDCDPQTALIDLAAAEAAISPKTRAILPVHLYGQMVSPRQLRDFAGTYNLLIFEDAAQAHLAEREGYRAGSIGTAAAFSFYPSKNLGAFGDGGAVVTSDPEVAKKMRTLRNYGAPQKYLHTEVGTNSRLDTLQAAILKVKLPYLAGWNRARNEAAQRYDALLSQYDGITPIQNQSGAGHVYHLYTIRTLACVSRDALQEELAKVGIQTGIHYPIPCHLQPAYEYLGYKAGDFPHAEALCREILSLPMYPGLEETQISQVAAGIESFITRQAAALR